VDALPAERLHLGARVSRVMILDRGLVLSLRDGETNRELVARQLILALPPRLLATTVGFEPAVDSETLLRWRQTATWMAPHAKFFALYDRPFWRESGLSGMAQSGVGPLVEIHDATLASGSAALFGFVGLDRRQRVEVGEEALVRAAIAQLVRLFGAMAGQPRATLFKDWTADAFTATEQDARAEGHPLPDSRPWIAGSWAPYVSLAGSETSFTYPGYLAGALDASERAVAEVVRRL
jgi:monoamine oxidase